MMAELKTITAEDLAALFKIDRDRLPPRVETLLNDSDFHYRVLDGEDRDAVLLQSLLRLDCNLSVSGPDRKDRWDEGWRENLEEFIASTYALSALLPKYYFSGNNTVLRLNGNYIVPVNPCFEVRFLELLREILVELYLRDVTSLHEFGCGPAHNVAAFAEMLPGVPVYGYDWASPTQQILSLLKSQKGLNVSGGCFDLFHPSPATVIGRGAGVITIGALEQTGDRFGGFLDYIMQQMPKICIHVEPIYEFYDQTKVMDVLAARYAEKRGYLIGLYTALKQAEQAGKVQILNASKLLGSKFHDGWSLVVWRSVV